jgi:hypothetical protein
MDRRDFLSKASMAFAASLAPVEVGAGEARADIHRIAELAEAAIGELLPPGVVGFEFRLTAANGVEIVELRATGAQGPLFYDLGAGVWK